MYNQTGKNFSSRAITMNSHISLIIIAVIGGVTVALQGQFMENIAIRTRQNKLSVIGLYALSNYMDIKNALNGKVSGCVFPRCAWMVSVFSWFLSIVIHCSSFDLVFFQFFLICFSIKSSSSQVHYFRSIIYIISLTNPCVISNCCIIKLEKIFLQGRLRWIVTFHW